MGILIENRIAAAAKLIDHLDTLVENWDERSQFKIKGEDNLSRSDIDTLTLYAEQFIKNGGNFEGLMEPWGSIRVILTKYEIIQ